MITHPEKVMFPDDGITKGEMAAYYEAIAPLMLPHMAGRPVTLERYPQGIGAKGFMHNAFKIDLARRTIIRALTQAAQGTPQSQSNKKIR